MPQTQRVSKNNTKIRQDAGLTVVTLHDTDIVKFGPDIIVLNSGGEKTMTTKNRMNQVSNEYGLEFMVLQKHGTWFVVLDNAVIPFSDGMVIGRKA